MRHLATALLAVVLGISLSGAAIAKKKSKSKARKKASYSCVSFSQSADRKARTITYRLENSCQETVACSIAWKVTCRGENGDTTEAHDETPTIMSGSETTLQASAASCGEDDGYEISAPVWACKVPTNNTARAE